MLSVFDIANNISNSREDISESDDFKKQYSQFMCNRIMACSPDTVLFANLMNQYQGVPDKFHYLFYHLSTHKRKRYFKYPKQVKEDNETLELIKTYYSVNDDKARDIIELLDKEIIDKIKLSYGGVR